MTEGTKTRRLSKVAREFNLGLSTMVDFLNKKGISVENNPNTKIAPETYDLLFQEFQSEKNLKEASRKAGLNLLKRENLSLEEGAVEGGEKASRKQEEPEDELFIKDTKGSVDQEPIRKEKVVDEDKVSREALPEKLEDNKLAGLKVVGKMDPERFGKKPAAEKSSEDKPVTPAKEQEQPTVEEKQIVEAEPPKEEAEKPVVEKESKLKILGKMELETPQPRGKKKVAPKRVEPVSEEKDKDTVTEKPTKPTSETVAEKPAIAEEKKEDSSEKQTIEPVEAEKAPKVEAEKPTVKEEKIEEEKREPAQEHHQTQFKKLEGPTILGKMDLPAPKEATKKPVASSSDPSKSKKRKRKRIRKDKPAEGSVAAQTDKKTGNPDPRPGKKPVRKDNVRPEVSDEEISRQIKETLANLSGGGKSKAARHRRMKRDIMAQQKEKEREQAATEKKEIQVAEFVSAAELANMMDVSVNEIISTCMSLGLFVSINQRLDAETISIVADEFGFDVDFVGVDSQDEMTDEADDDPALQEDRAPIVTVMGHVDHGKTSLLDKIRHSNVIAGEAGGITQHIGAYSVELENGKKISFLDTPGHEAFTAMRARGAKVTDVAIIVVAADDSVMPQTVEAINHAQAAGVPIVIAINKMDKENAAPEKVKEQLAQLNILVEDWGGNYQCQEISALKGLNIDSLLEKVLLEAELKELKANPSKKANGTIIESALDKGRGYVATILVQNGTLRVGDIVVAGSAHGKVKAMFNERGHRIDEAPPSTPVLILGLDSAPLAGDIFKVVATEGEAKSITNKRQQLLREQGLRTQKHITLDEIGRRIAIGDFKELNVIVKGDVDGSVEALGDSLLKLSTEEIQVNIIHKAVGQVTEGDVLLASASNAIIIGFQVRPSVAARKLAEHEQIDIRMYSIIYNAINEIKSAIEGMLSPEIKEKILANLEVRDVFKITKVGTVAGCRVLDGKIHRNSSIRLIRDGIVVYTGHLGSLKRFKDDVREVASGYECGLNIDRFNDIKVGDIVEAFETVEIARKLD